MFRDDKRMRAIAALLVLAVAETSAQSPPASAQPASVTVQEWSTPGPNSIPRNLFVASDSSIWYTDPGNDVVGHFDLSTAKFKQHGMNSVNYRPHGLALDGGGNIWFTATNKHVIGIITPAGVIREFDLQSRYPR